MNCFSLFLASSQHPLKLYGLKPVLVGNIYIIIYQTHVEVHQDRVVLSVFLLRSGDSLPGNGAVGKPHQDLENKQEHFIQ